MTPAALTALGLVLFAVAVAATAIFLGLRNLERERNGGQAYAGAGNANDGAGDMPAREAREERQPARSTGSTSEAARLPARAAPLASAHAAGGAELNAARAELTAEQEELDAMLDRILAVKAPSTFGPATVAARQGGLDRETVLAEVAAPPPAPVTELGIASMRLAPDARPPVTRPPAPAGDGRSLQRLSLREAIGRLEEAFHIAILGGTGSGKTTTAKAIMSIFGGQFMVIDPNWKPGKWSGGLSVTTTIEDDYLPIIAALRGLWAEFVQRRKNTLAGEQPGEMLNVIWEETNDTVEEAKKVVGQMMRRWLRRARQYKIRLILFVQSDRVEALGIAGHGDARKNLVFMLLGSDAVERVKWLREQGRVSAEYLDSFAALPYPAVVELGGVYYEIDTSEAPSLASAPIEPGRFWQPDRVMQLAKTGIIPSIDQHTLQSVASYVALEEPAPEVAPIPVPASLVGPQSQPPAADLELTPEMRRLILAGLSAKPAIKHSKIAKSLPGYSGRRYADYVALVKKVAGEAKAGGD